MDLKKPGHSIPLRKSIDPDPDFAGIYGNLYVIPSPAFIGPLQMYRL